MGTKKSRHNKGRKPLYKEHRLIAAHLIERPYFFKGGRYNARTWWKPDDIFKLNILAEADSDIEASADALGRPPTTLVHKAREQGFVIPSEWARLIYRKRATTPKERHKLLSYPYIRTPTAANADILEINDLVPKHLPENMRADICQEIMVAILEGRTTIESLRTKKSAYFIKKFYRENYEAGGFAISFDATRPDWDSDAVHSSIAAKEWHRDRAAERASAYRYMTQTYTPATQFEAAWQEQIGRIHLQYHELGQYLSKEEIAELFDEPA